MGYSSCLHKPCILSLACLAFSPIDCDHCEIIEEFYGESIGAEERDSLQFGTGGTVVSQGGGAGRCSGAVQPRHDVRQRCWRAQRFGTGSPMVSEGGGTGSCTSAVPVGIDVPQWQW